MKPAQIRIDGGSRQDFIGWRRASGENAMMQIPSRVKIYAIETHGRSTFQERRTRELPREKQSSVKRVADSRRIKLPSDEKAHLPRGARGGATFVPRNEPDRLGEFRGKRIGILQIKARASIPAGK